MRIKRMEVSDLTPHEQGWLVRVAVTTELGEYTCYAQAQTIEQAQVRAYHLCLMFAQGKPAMETVAMLEDADDVAEEEISSPDEVTVQPTSQIPSVTKGVNGDSEKAGKRFAVACHKLNQSWSKEHVSAIAKLLTLILSPEEAAEFAESCKYPRQLALKALECYYGSLDEVKRHATLKPLSQYSMQELTDWLMDTARQVEENQS